MKRTAVNNSDVHLPPFHVEEVPLTRILQELSNWAFQSFQILKLWQHTEGEDVKVCVLDTGCSHKDIEVFKAMDFTGKGHTDENGHGTWCAGAIRATLGFLGIAPKCKLYVGKVLANDGSGSWNWIKQGFEWALEEGCQIVSVSAGGDYYGDEIQPILEKLHNSGALVICAAGNSNDPLIFPANSPHTIAVGAVNKKWERAIFSNYGPRLIVMAPGVELLGCWKNNGYGKLTGTSMATPIVAGIATLEKELRPMNLEEAIVRFSETSRDIEEPGWDKRTGHGIIEPRKFLKIKAEDKKSKGWLGFLLILLFLILKVPVAAVKKLL